MSEARLELVETKQVRQFAFDIVVGVLGMDESDMDDQAYASEQVEGWMEHWEKSRRVMSVPTDQMVEAGAIQLCHWDGWDYGEPYDKWPESIIDTDGQPWANQSDAHEDYRDRARAILTAAFNTLGIQETVK
jgi:hypothetical protein